MGREITIKVYSIDELDKDAKEYAIAKFREYYPEDWWANDLIETLKEELDDKGYPDSEIGYSGFWSQGDGASFTCPVVDIKKWLQNTPKTNKEYANYQRIVKLLDKGFIDVYTAKVVRDNFHNYVHENTISAYTDFRLIGRLGTDAKRVCEVLEKIEEDINTEIKTLSKDIYSRLQKEYESITSDKAIIAELKDRDNVYLANGTLFHE